jgi:ZIP family zinc transporter
MWSTVVVSCGIAAALGYLVVAFDESVAAERAAVIAACAAAVAAGGLLTMLTNTLMPLAFESGGRFAGVWTVVGFALSLALV